MPASTVHSLLIKKENAHDDPIYCCAWTKTRLNQSEELREPCKDFIVTAGLDCLVKVWKLEFNKLELLHSLEGHPMAVVSVAVSPDGHSIASSSLDGTLIIWDLLFGHKVHEIQTEATDVWTVAFSPVGTQVVSGSHTGKLVIYGIEKGSTDRVLDTRGKFVLSVDWSADGKYIASGSQDGAVCIFDVAQGKLLHTVEAHSKLVRSVSFSANSKLFVSASNDGKVKVFDTASANVQGTLNHETWAVSARMSPDGSRVATSTADGSVRIILLDGLKVMHTFKEHTHTAWGVHFNAESNKLLSVSKDKSINIYECPIPPKAPVKK